MLAVADQNDPNARKDNLKFIYLPLTRYILPKPYISGTLSSILSNPDPILCLIPFDIDRLDVLHACEYFRKSLLHYIELLSIPPTGTIGKITQGSLYIFLYQSRNHGTPKGLYFRIHP